METQKTPTSQSNLEKEKGRWRNWVPWLQTILQSNINQNSMVLAQNEEYRSVEKDTKSRNKSTHTYGQLIYDKGGKTIQWRTVSSASGAGKVTCKKWN